MEYQSKCRFSQLLWGAFPLTGGYITILWGLEYPLVSSNMAGPGKSRNKMQVYSWGKSSINEGTPWFWGKSISLELTKVSRDWNLLGLAILDASTVTKCPFCQDSLFMGAKITSLFVTKFTMIAYIYIYIYYIYIYYLIEFCLRMRWCKLSK